MLFGIGSILLLHRVAPYEKGKILYNENLKISPEELDEIIINLKKSYTFISLDELYENIKTKRKSNHRFISVTLDDGYKDNFTFGLDIFRKHRVPFCIYVTNSFPNKTTNLWWFALENLILQNNQLTLSSARKIENFTDKQKKKNFLSIRREILNHHFTDPLKYLKQIGSLDFDILKEQIEKCLTWDELETIAREPLATIGCHTLNHFPLSKLKYEDAFTEILFSKNELEQRLNTKINHFAFPFGSKREVSSREFDILNRMNFDTVVTASHSHIYQNSKLQKLGRIHLHSLKNNNTSFNSLAYMNVRTLFSLVQFFFLNYALEKNR